MTTTEFSNQFDILWNNIMSNQAPGLDEYEKSVFLTDAQEQVVLTYYGGRPNSAISFELTEEIRRYLGSLVKTAEIEGGGSRPIIEWVKKPLSEITDADTFVFVGNNGGHYAMSNINGVEMPPDAVPVTVSDNKLVGEMPESIQWYVEGNEDDGYIFHPVDRDTAWLYCGNSNNGVRVGVNDYPEFDIIDGYLHHIDTDRYVGVYTPSGQTISQSWRCYTSYTGTSNIAGQSFDYYVKTQGEGFAPELPTLSDKSQIFNLPEDLWFITYEAATLESEEDSCIDGKTIDVVPVTQDAYHRTEKNPFKGPNDRRALRLDIGDHKVELVSNYTISKYLVRYVEKLQPIILTNLSNGLTIRGKSTAQTCALNDAVHSLILTTAVSLARDAMGKTFVKSQQ